jgi:catechol 2,3-dioxygenase-like lactoylglutathione lyase family enzyme
MNKSYVHHVLIAADDLERSRQFYSGVLELQEINRPAFAYPGIWCKIGRSGAERFQLSKSI